jgi:hypothetical protein
VVGVTVRGFDGVITLTDPAIELSTTPAASLSSNMNSSPNEALPGLSDAITTITETLSRGITNDINVRKR